MGPVDEHAAAMFTGTFHQDKFPARTGLFTGLISFDQGFVYTGVDVSVVEDLITETAEIAKVRSLKRHEIAVLQFSFPDTSGRFTGAGIDMGHFRNGQQAEQHNYAAEEDPSLFYFHAE
jgi:hypothetical protein